MSDQSKHEGPHQWETRCTLCGGESGIIEYTSESAEQELQKTRDALPTIRAIINAIGEISVQEALDAIDTLIAKARSR